MRITKNVDYGYRSKRQWQVRICRADKLSACRVKKHKLQRDGKGFETIEQYQNIGGALKGCKRDTKPVVLVECMSNLLANECFEENGHPDNIFAECMQLYSECSHLVIVTNEVFSEQTQVLRLYTLFL